MAHQSLNRADVLRGGRGNDILFGLNGDDVIDGGAAGNILATVRVAEVEQVFCSQDGGIALGLTLPSPGFDSVSQQEVATLHPLVAAMIR